MQFSEKVKFARKNLIVFEKIFFFEFLFHKAYEDVARWTINDDNNYYNNTISDFEKLMNLCI